MSFTLYAPSDELAPYVAGYVVWENATEAVPVRRQPMMPNGYAGMLFKFGDSRLRYDVQPSGSLLPDCSAFGQYTQTYFIESTGSNGAVLVYFKPHTALYFLHHPVWLFTNQHIEAGELFGTGWQREASRVRDARDKREAISLIEPLLLKILHRQLCIDSPVTKTIRALHQTHGTIPIEKILAHTGIGRRCLEQRFRLLVGVSPKVYARIVRFNYVLHLLSQTSRVNWSDLTYSGGYFDQPHLIRSFKEFTGASPAAYWKEHSVTAPGFYILYTRCYTCWVPNSVSENLEKDGE